MSERDAVEALATLGLTAYEAKVFIALRKLGTGTASEVARVTDVPRSQVYGAAESLEERGLLEVQQASPMRYRPVSLDAAKDHLRSRFEAHESVAFDYLERVDDERADREHAEDIWTIQGREQVDTRVADLVAAASGSVVYAGDSETMTPAVVDALEERAAAGVDVTVVSADADFASLSEGVDTRRFESDLDVSRDRTGRALMVDRASILLSVRSDAPAEETSRETAILSEETEFARVLGRLLRTWFETHVDGN